MAQEQRRLAAIVAADVVGYSRLMGRDESGTLASLKALRRDVVDPRIAAHNGRIVKTTGDGLLLEFPSVVDAARCAVDVQTAMTVATADVAEDRRLVFRIGINLGDIIIEGDDIFGDGVNIAARLEAIAEPGGLCVSQAVYDSINGKIDIAFVDGGRPELKNIAVPVSVWHWQRDGKRTIKAAGAGGGLPVIAVLPFQNRSSDTEQEYFSDGISEDIITSLSKFRAFHVIARNTTFAFKGNALDIGKVGRELKADYLVEGSVRSLGNRVRITAELIAVANGTALWAERYDRELKDIFEVQDEITVRIATAVDPAIRSDQTRRALSKHPADLKAWDHLLRGLWHLNRFRKEANAQARREFEQAIACDDRFAPAHAWLAMTHVFDAWFNWTDRHAEPLERASAAAAEAVRLDDTEPMSHAAVAMTCFWTGRMDQARHAAERAISLNSNLFLANFVRGGAGNYSGQCEAAVPYHLKALDLSPNDPLAWNCLGSLAHTYLNLGRFEDAVACADRALVLRHGYLFARLIKTAALGHAGRIGDAGAAVATLFDVAPDFSLSRLDHYPFVLASQKDHLLRGLSLAGLHGFTPAPEAPAASPSLALPDKPSIAVLPFQNMSGDPEQEYFADGISEDIITALSNFKLLFVIARNSSFTYKGRAIDTKQVGRELGVRYVLEGSVRKAGGKVRITGQLIEAAGGGHLWAEKIDGELNDVFKLQDLITTRVVSSIAPTIEQAEIERLKQRPTNSTHSYDTYLRGMALHYQRRYSESRSLFKMAAEQNPEFAAAYAASAFTYSLEQAINGVIPTPELRADALRDVNAALSITNDDALVLARCSHPIAYICQQFDRAALLADRAVMLNPNLATAWNLRGWISLMLGNPEQAIESFETLMRLSPLDPARPNAMCGIAFGHFFLNRYGEGRRVANEVLQVYPNHQSFATYIANSVGVGDLVGAKRSAEQFLKFDPCFRVSRAAAIFPVRSPEQREQLDNALRRAGVPE